MSIYKKIFQALTKFLAALALLSTTAVFADSDITEAEFLLLPDYCKSQGNVSEKFVKKYFSAARTEKWQAAFGSDFNHFHHYCWALVSINRAYKSSRPGQGGPGREFHLTRAFGDIAYVLDRASPEFILLPEIYTKLGEAYLLARNDRNAEAAFRKAWSINPAYWRAYVWWADWLLRQGKLNDALAVAEEGQKNAPGTRQLDALIEEIRAAGKKGHKK